MSISLRQLLAGVSATAVAAVAIPLKFLGRLPVLYGDGIHDDTKALQVLIDGKEVAYKGETLLRAGKYVSFPAGAVFKITKPLVIDDPDIILNANWSPIHYARRGIEFRGRAAINVEFPQNLHLSKLHPTTSERLRHD